MIIFTTFCLVGVVLCQDGNEYPEFTWLEDTSPFGVPLLKIDFKDGLESDLAILRRFNPIPAGPAERSEDIDSCIYNGFLEKENNVHVTLTGCPHSGNLQIQFTSSRSKRTMFHIEEGRHIRIDYEQEALSNDIMMPTPGILKRNKVAPQDTKPLSVNGYIANIKIFYDDKFKDKFQDESVNVVRRLIAHAQHVWKYPSLTTKVIFNVDPNVEHIPERYNASDSLGEASTKYSKDVKIHSHMYLTTETPKSGVTGRGYLGGACYNNSVIHSLIAEYYVSDIRAALTISHEFGHNMNMNHDFGSSQTVIRYSSTGVKCTGSGGIMDYGSVTGDYTRWSDCSVEDFTKMVNKYPTCLKEIDHSNPPIEIEKQPLGPRECDMNKQYPGINGFTNFNYFGLSCRVACLDGICAPLRDACYNKTASACQDICNQDNCDTAVEPPPCNMTNFGYDSTTAYKFCYNGKKFQAICTKGYCVPYKYDPRTQGLYTNTCMLVCGYPTCEKYKSNC